MYSTINPYRSPHPAVSYHFWIDRCPAGRCPLLPPGAVSSAHRRRSPVCPGRSRGALSLRMPPPNPSAAMHCAGGVAVGRARWKYIQLQYSQNFCTACRPRRIHKYDIQYKHGADRRSLEPRPTDGGASCAAAGRLRGRRRARGCALDRRSASLTRGHRARRQQRAATCRAPIYPEVV